MTRIGTVGLALLIVAILAWPTAGEDKQPEPRTFTVSCKWVHKTWLFVGSNDKSTLEKNEVNIPDITTLENTSAEHHAGGKLGSAPFGFRLQVHVLPVTASKVRLKIVAEDSSAESGLTRTHSQRVERQISFGKMIKLVLDEKPNGEGIWVELTVREARED